MQADGAPVKFIVILVTSQFERCLGRIDDVPRMLWFCPLQFSIYIYLEIFSIISAHHMVPEFILEIRGTLQVGQSLVSFAGEGEGKLTVHITQQPSAFIIPVVLNNAGNPPPTHQCRRAHPRFNGNGFLRHLDRVKIIGYPGAAIGSFKFQLVQPSFI